MTVKTGDQILAADVYPLVIGGSPGGRLTLETGVPVSRADQSAKATLYYTPYKSNLIVLYDGSEWNAVEFAEISLSLAGLTANKNYDVFAYDNSGAVTLEALVWTDEPDQTRATALVQQDGVLVKSGAATRRYLGTIRINGTGGQTEDTAKDRFVWNLYNQELRQGRKSGLSGNTNQTLGKLEYVIGNPYGQTVLAGLGGKCTGHANSYCGLYLMFDTASIDTADAFAGIWSQTALQIHAAASFAKNVAAGYHYVSMGLNVQTTDGVLAEGYTWMAVWG